MQEIQLVHYCHPHCSPLSSITRLPEEEAFQKAEALSSTLQGTAFGRFADFAHYYPQRMRTEQWLYDCFVQMGGQPETEHPLYFVLQGSEYLQKWFENGKVYKIPLNTVKIRHISFTFGDSMSKMDTLERKPPFMLPELSAHLAQYHNRIDAFLDSIQEKYTYIEAQLWSDRYIAKNTE